MWGKETQTPSPCPISPIPAETINLLTHVNRLSIIANAASLRPNLFTSHRNDPFTSSESAIFPPLRCFLRNSRLDLTFIFLVTVRGLNLFAGRLSRMRAARQPCRLGIYSLGYRALEYLEF